MCLLGARYSEVGILLAGETEVEVIAASGPSELGKAADDELPRPVIDRIAGQLRAVALAAGKPLHTVALAGGASAHPLVREVLGEPAGQLITDPAPATLACRGAAATARLLVQPRRANRGNELVTTGSRKLAVAPPPEDLELPPPRPPVAIAPLDPPGRWRSRLPRLRRQQDREVSR